jgi:hypothetical protein
MPIQPDHYALVIGIDDYPSGDLRSLEHAKHDAEAFRNWLIDPGTGGGVPEENCKLILSRGELLLPNFDEIDDHLDRIIKLAEKSHANARRLYFYFSGHGMAARQLQTFLCLPRWSNRWRNAALDSQAYSTYLVNSGLFREIVFLFDCCRSYKPSVLGHGSSPDFSHGGKIQVALRCVNVFETTHFRSQKERLGNDRVYATDAGIPCPRTPRGDRSV